PAQTRRIGKQKSMPRAIGDRRRYAMISTMPDYKRIATEEAWATRDQITLFRKLLADGYDDPGYRSLWGFYLNSPSERARFIVDRLQDLGPARIAEMDASGI